MAIRAEDLGVDADPLSLRLVRERLLAPLRLVVGHATATIDGEVDDPSAEDDLLKALARLHREAAATRPQLRLVEEGDDA